MTVKKYVGDKATGLSSDTKPTNMPEGATFYELDTGKVYRRYSSAWTEIDNTKANLAFNLANTVFAHANAAYAKANTANVTADLAFGTANIAFSQANTAYTAANTALDTALAYAIALG